MKFHLITISLIFISWNCLKDESPITSNNINNSLSTKIPGFWHLRNQYFITFYEDGTFKDSSIATYDGGPEYIRSGKYEIEDDILKFINFSYLYNYMGKYVTASWSSMMDYKISIVGDTLKRMPITVLNTYSTDNTNLYKEWFEIKWLNYSDNSDPEPLIRYEGWAEWFHIFNESSLIYESGIRYIDSDSLEDFYSDSVIFFFSSPYLQIGSSDTLKVELSKDKLIWLWEKSTTQLIRF